MGCPTPTRDIELADRSDADHWLRQESAHWFRALHAAASAGRHREVIGVALRLHWFSDRWLQWGRWHELFSLGATSAGFVGDAEHADLLGHVGWAQIVEREAFTDAAATAARAESLARGAGATLQEAWAVFYRAWAESRLDRIDDAVVSAHAAFELFDEVHDPAGAAQALMLAVFALRQAGRNAEVQARADLVLDYLDRESLDDYVAICTRANAAMYSAQAALALGTPEVALGWADRSVGYADSIGFHRVGAEAAAVHAEATLELGRQDAAIAELAGVLARFEAMGARERADAIRARRQRLLVV